MRIICGELVKTAPADVMISNRQSINTPASSCPAPVSRAGWRGVCCLLGDVSFPVVFVLFRLVPELNISSGIIRLCCDFLLAYR